VIEWVILDLWTGDLEVIKADKHFVKKGVQAMTDLYAMTLCNKSWEHRFEVLSKL